MLNENEYKSIYLDTNELITTIVEFLITHNRKFDFDLIETILATLLLDTFAPLSTEGYLDQTTAVFRPLKINATIVNNFLPILYNQLLGMINSFRMSENLDYLDKLNVDLITLHLLKVTYDPKKKVIAHYTF